MLFKPGSPVAKITESLHKSVIYELNRVPEIHLNTCHCIGATIGTKLDIWIDNKSGHRCTPVGTSLFLMECIIPTAVINHPRNISLQKLTQVLSSRFSRTQPLKADVYFIVSEEEFENFRSTVSPLCSMGLNELLPVYNIGKFGAFCVCRPKSIGNRGVDVLFDEYKALRVLGGLEDSNFFKTPLSTSNTTKRNTKQSTANNREQKFVVTGKKIQSKIQSIKHLHKIFSRSSTTQCSPLSTPVNTKTQHNIEEKTASSTQEPNIQKVIVTSNQPNREKTQLICTKFPEAPKYPSLNQRQETGGKYLEQRLSKSTADSTPFTQKGTTDSQQVVRPKTQFASSPFYFYQEQPLLTTKHSSSNQRQETGGKYLEQRLSKSTADSTPFTQKGTTDSQQVVRPKTQFASSPFYFYQEQPLLTTKHSSSNQRQETGGKYLEQRLSKSTADSTPFTQKGTTDSQQVVRPKTFASSSFYKESALAITKHPSSNQRQEATNKHLEQRPSTKSTVDPQQVVRPKTQSASSRVYKEQGLPTTKHKILSAIKESTDSSTSVNTLSSEEDLRFLNVDYSSSCEILYDTFRESYRVSALPTSPLIPSHQLEDDVFVEDGYPRASYL
ncbi:Hypothetical protein ERGA_CDS_05750 [Ehrlichia ruminantium str. Gardel]|uniref:DUF3023 domain-containing protein n=1 Tax=Ehrlichia ruminantium TaxID=779 RepID=UPI00004C7869|nr:DUF3023 domain-containing protein [Ehrlichia ruminantium]CAI28027.1 Hypothetical protein ERGA_CDS_05750 [Ehrlichia ruminantium str. Gardel]